MISGILTAVLLFTFIGLWVWAWSWRRQADFLDAANLPLQDDDGATGESRR